MTEPTLCFDCGENRDKSVGGAFVGNNWVCLQCLVKSREQLMLTKAALERVQQRIDQLEIMKKRVTQVLA